MMVMMIKKIGGRGPKLVYSAHRPKLFQTEAYLAFTHLLSFYKLVSSKALNFFALEIIQNLPFAYDVSNQFNILSSKVQRYLDCTAISPHPMIQGDQ